MTKKICFMIQPFCEPYENRFDIVYKPAIEHAGLIPHRAGGPEAEVITEDIEDGIRNAHICFADITENNPNVWYEVGFAYACGKSVVMVCNKAVRGDKGLPFDISVKNVVFYKDAVDSSQSDRDRFKQEITGQAKARAKKADSDNNAIPVVAQQSQNFDNSLTSFDLKVLKAILIFDSEHNRPIPVGSIMANLLGEKKEYVLISINKMELADCIYKVTSIPSRAIGYSPTEKGRHWFHTNSD